MMTTHLVVWHGDDVFALSIVNLNGLFGLNG